MARGTSSGRVRGFTLVEALTLVAGVGAVSAVVGVTSAGQPAGQPPQPPAAQPAATQPPSTGGGNASQPTLISAMAKARASARQLKCSTQVRGINQAMVVWASNNKSMYPLPSQLDTANATVAAAGRAKDTTSNIYSLLIWNGHISPEICICPDEHGKNVKRFADYEYTMPKKAAKPADALWDPAFSADFAAGTGHTSYAHLQPSGDLEGEKDANGKPFKASTGRLPMWSDTYNSTEAAIGDRGPEIQSVDTEKPEDLGSYKAKTKIADSVTLKNHGDPGSWEGNVAFNDNHVEFMTSLGPAPKPLTHFYQLKDGTKRADALFFDEPDDANATNTFLGIFVGAGKKPAEFKGIWD